jgi:hypothetical protein
MQCRRSEAAPVAATNSGVLERRFSRFPVLARHGRAFLARRKGAAAPQPARLSPAAKPRRIAK